MLPLSFNIKKDSMTVLWGNESSEQGKTIYALKGNYNMLVTDFVFKDGTYKRFGEATYEKSNHAKND